MIKQFQLSVQTRGQSRGRAGVRVERHPPSEGPSLSGESESFFRVAADALLQRWRALAQGADAALVGYIDATAQRVTMTTELGGERILEELEDDPLPRIC